LTDMADKINGQTPDPATGDSSTPPGPSPTPGAPAPAPTQPPAPPPTTPPAPPPAFGHNINQDAQAIADETAKVLASAGKTSADAETLNEEINGIPDQLAAKDSEIAALQAKLHQAEVRATLPPLAGNPAPAPPAQPATGYELILKAIEDQR
jgi:hypothetical protein